MGASVSLRAGGSGIELEYADGCRSGWTAVGHGGRDGDGVDHLTAKPLRPRGIEGITDGLCGVY